MGGVKVCIGRTFNKDSWAARWSPALLIKNFVRKIAQQKLLLLVVLSVLLRVAAAAPITFDLTDSNPVIGARFIGSDSGTTGSDVAIIGDHNGDGFVDYIIGSKGHNRAVIVMKKDTAYVEVDVSILVSDQYFRVIQGPAASGLGSSVGGAGDINGDGYADVIIGAVSGTVAGRGQAGYAFVIFGMVGPFTDVTVTATWTASAVGFMILGPEASTELFQRPRSTRGLGDVNGDGFDDFAVATRVYSGTTSKPYAGVVWVMFGKNTPFTTIDLLPANFASNGIIFTGASQYDYLSTVMPAGDFNGDGIADFLLGAYGVDKPPIGDAGAVYLLYGSATALVTMDLSTFVTGSKGVRFIGDVGNGRLGYSLGGVGDINGDGIDDIALAAPPISAFSRTLCGIVFIVYGNTATYTTTVDLFNVNDFTKGFFMYGAAEMTLSFAAPAGDIDGDGVNDIFVAGQSHLTKAHIVFGQKTVRTANVDTELDNVISFSVTSLRSLAFLGTALDGGKDLTGDGVPDLLLSAYSAAVTPAAGGAERVEAGAVYLLPGPLNYPNPTASPTLVPSVAPSAVPSIVPSVVPSAVPSAELSVEPSAQFSEKSTVEPSAEPSAEPTAEPTAEVTIEPSVDPTVEPSAEPSADPSASPTLTLSGMPTVDPSAVPTVVPTAEPSALPTQDPSASPSSDPSAYPTVIPTVIPSAVPSARPTITAVKNFELAVNVLQELSISKASYDQDKVASNLTIQHTVADAVTGALPERVTDIAVVGETGSRVGASYHVSAASTILLKYKITVNDPVLTVEKLRASLVQAAREGKMDRDLHFYASRFGAMALSNATFAEPQVTSAAVQRDASVKLTGVQIALLVIGVVMSLIIVAVVWIGVHQQGAAPSPPVQDLV